MNGSSLDAVACAVFIVFAFSLAGCAQAAWLAWPSSRRLGWPLDGGATFRGRRLFGANKTLRGIIVIVPATGASFMALAAVLPPAGRWMMPLTTYAAVGVFAGLGFMAAELPNSFVKRQLDVPPGEPARGRIAQPLFLAADHLDSTCGTIGALALVVPMSVECASYVLAVGWVVHIAFSALTFQLGGKARAA